MRKADFVSQTTLKRIEPHRLKELILAHLQDYPNSAIGENHKCIGTEIKVRILKIKIDNLLAEELVIKNGQNRWTKYSLNINA